MFTPERACLMLLLVTASASAGDPPNLGQPMTPAEVDLIDFTVLPDGTGLPPGEGSALEGRALYELHCQACHGAGGEDGLNDRLVGGQGSIDGPRPVKTVGSYWPYATTLFDYLRRAMPYAAPGSLNDNEIYAVTAYLLYLNDIVAEDFAIDADSLPRVRMPNRDSFDRAWPAVEPAERRE